MELAATNLRALSSLAKRFVQKRRFGRSYNSQSSSSSSSSTISAVQTTVIDESTCNAAQPVILGNILTGTVKRRMMELRDLKQMIKSIDHFDPDGHEASREGAEEMHKSHRCFLSAELRQEFSKLCANFLDGKWNTVDPEKLIVKHIKGGMSNILFLVELPKSYTNNMINVSNGRPPVQSSAETPCSKALLRIYFNPEMESRLVSESVVFTLLSERGIGPKLFGIFNDGRLEEFITSKTLETPDIWKPDVSRSIATKLASFHKLCLPISKKPTYLLEALERWFSRLKKERPDFVVKLDLAANGRLCFADLYNEFALLRKAISCSSSSVVFCHNDLQEGNILAPTGDDTDDIVVIDFEYASYNYRAFDFANHFCEWTIDYSYDLPPFFTHKLSQFPNEDQQKNFFRPYLKEMGLEYDAVDLHLLIKETKPFVPVSHFFWAVWSLLQHEISPVNFGFLAYAEERLRMYFKLRHDLVSLIQDMNNNSNSNGCS